MGQITPVGVNQLEDDERFLVKTGKVTIKGADFFITTTPTGLYCVQTTDSGNKPKICEEKFTSLYHARKALEEYEFDNRVRLAVRERGKQKRKEFEENDEKRDSEALSEL